MGVSLSKLASFNVPARLLVIVDAVPSSDGLRAVSLFVATPPITAPVPNRAALRVHLPIFAPLLRFWALCNKDRHEETVKFLTLNAVHFIH